MRRTLTIDIILLLEMISSFAHIDAHSREKRLIFLPGADKIQVIVGVGVPVDLERETVIFGILFKGNYAIPSNISAISPLEVLYERGTRSAMAYYNDTFDIFERSLFSRMQSRNICILRAICETAMMSQGRNDGLVAEIIRTILRFVKDEMIGTKKVTHMEAYYQGLENPDVCASIYSGCEMAFTEPLAINT